VNEMTAANWIGYFAYLIELEKMTEEEAHKQLQAMYEADIRQDEFDRKMVEEWRKLKESKN
jgi:hypothetical protein